MTILNNDEVAAVIAAAIAAYEGEADTAPPCRSLKIRLVDRRSGDRPTWNTAGQLVMDNCDGRGIGMPQPR